MFIGEDGKVSRVQLLVPKAVGNAACSWTVVPGLADPQALSFKSNGQRGKYMAIGDTLSGSCAGSYDTNTKDVGLFAAPPADAATWRISDKQPPSPPPPPAPKVYSSWNQYTSPGVMANFSMDATAPFHGLNSQKISLATGEGVAVVGT